MKKLLLLLLLAISVFSQLPSSAQPSQQPNQGKTITTTKEAVTSGGAISLPLIVSLVALVSALASVWLSLKVKDKEYRNDYYKIVIGKRLKALEAAEQLVGVLNKHNRIHKPGHILHDQLFNRCLYTDADRAEYRTYKEAAVSLATWYSPSTETVFNALGHVLSQVYFDVGKISLEDRPFKLVESFPTIAEAAAKLELAINTDMRELHKVDMFFASKIEHTASLLKKNTAG